SGMDVDFRLRIKEYGSGDNLQSTSSWQSFPFTLQTYGQPQLSLMDYGNYQYVTDGGTISLGTVNVCDTIERNLYLMNNGYGRLTLDAASLVLPSGFSLGSALPTYIDSYSGVYVPLDFHVTSTGTYGGQIHLINNDNSQPIFDVTLSATAAVLAP